MKLINLENKQYPIAIEDIRKLNPNISYPDLFNYIPEGYALVETSVFPEYDSNTHSVKEGSPICKDGKWKQTWITTELTDKEKTIKLEAIKRQIINARNALLNLSDWTQLSDVSLSNINAWNTYRQQLRDITKQSDFPYNVVWPKSPDNES